MEKSNTRERFLIFSVNLWNGYVNYILGLCCRSKIKWKQTKQKDPDNWDLVGIQRYGSQAYLLNIGCLVCIFRKEHKHKNVVILSTLYCNALMATESIQHVIEIYVIIWLPHILFSDNSTGKQKAKKFKAVCSGFGQFFKLSASVYAIAGGGGYRSAKMMEHFFTGWPHLDWDSVLFPRFPNSLIKDIQLWLTRLLDQSSQSRQARMAPRWRLVDLLDGETLIWPPVLSKWLTWPGTVGRFHRQRIVDKHSFWIIPGFHNPEQFQCLLNT